MNRNKILDWITNIFYIPLVICAIWGSFNCLFSSITGTNNWGVFFLGIIVIIGIGLITLKSGKFFTVLRDHFIKHQRIYITICFIALILWQLYVAQIMLGMPGWDPGIIFYTATKHYKDVWVSIHQYFSTYPNTIFLLLLERGIWTLFGMPGIKETMWIFEIINIILIDLSIIFIAIFTKNVVKSKVTRNVAVFLWVILMGISPWMSIVYSDNLAFFLSASELFLIYLWQRSQKLWQKSVVSLILGIVAALDLLIKPSTIVFFIALIVILIFNPKYIFSKLKRNLCCLIIFLIGLISVSGGVKQIQNNNLDFTINPKMSFSMAHFAAMGIHGTGGFYNKDVIIDQKIKNPDKRNASDIKRWQKRLERKGFFGYLGFLANKQSINFGAGGSQGWGCEGNFLRCFDHHRAARDSLPRHLFASNRNLVKGYNAGYFVFLQVFWCLGLIIMLVAVSDHSVITQLMKITFIGFSLFLLIFESGRSRYLIQFLPFILVLMGVGTQKVIDKFQNKKYKPRH